jgi:hypothetical protein
LEAGTNPDPAAFRDRLEGNELARFNDTLTDYDNARARLDAVVRPGLVFAGRYRIDGQIGAGGMGSIYRAFDLQLDRPVAVKARGIRARQVSDSGQQLRQSIGSSKPPVWQIAPSEARSARRSGRTRW